MQLKCKNPHCKYDARKLRGRKIEFMKGWCNRCYKLFVRNGSLAMDDRVPAYSQKTVTFAMFVEGAVKHKYDMEKFLWEYKVSIESLNAFEKENKVDYEESRINGQIAFV